jgi:hypothetical protein
MRQINLIRKEVLVHCAIRDPLLDLLPTKGNGDRHWQAFSNTHLVAFAQKFVDENGISSRKGLQKADNGLYQALWRRGLIDRVITESAHSSRKESRDWASLSDEQLISHAQNVVEENGIRNRKGLAKADSGLYDALRKRGLLGRAIPEKRETRDWASLDDGQLVSHAQKFIEENEIKKRKELAKADSGLYDALRKRGLIGELIPGNANEKNRDWTSFSDEQLVSHAQKFIEEKGIKNRSGLVKADGGLYRALRNRGLLDPVFAPIEQKNKDELLGQLAEAVDAYTN